MGELALRFILGLAFGSFLNVLAFRYDPERFVLSRQALGGRSSCPKCRTKLSWHDLVPVLSYALLKGRCRTCREKISWQYPVVELLAGFIFILPIPLPIALMGSGYLPLLWAAGWIAALMGLLLMAIIDIRWRIIPDELHGWFVALGAVLIWAARGSGDFSFLGGYGPLFGLPFGPWASHIFAALLGGAFFLSLVLLTKGRGMGMGDAKLGVSLGFLFGWPDIGLLIMLAFLIGAVYGLVAMTLGRSRMKTTVPFGPFLAVGSLAVALWGERILSAYFGLFGIY